MPIRFLHERILACKELSRTYRSMGWWVDLVISSPTSMPWGVSSPPNCLVILGCLEVD